MKVLLLFIFLSLWTHLYFSLVDDGEDLEWLKKPMKPLACWRSPGEALGPTLSGLMTLQPLLGSWSSYMMMMTLYGPWKAIELLVWWRIPWNPWQRPSYPCKGHGAHYLHFTWLDDVMMWSLESCEDLHALSLHLMWLRHPNTLDWWWSI